MGYSQLRSTYIKDINAKNPYTQGFCVKNPCIKDTYTKDTNITSVCIKNIYVNSIKILSKHNLINMLFKLKTKIKAG